VFGTRHVVLLEQDRFDLDELIGVPTQPEIALGDGDPLVTWELAVGGDGPIDDYVLTLFDVTATGLLPVRTIITDHASALIDRTLLVPGHVYIVRLDARLGVPGASDGFFLTTQYPFATATTWSAAFTAR